MIKHGDGGSLTRSEAAFGGGVPVWKERSDHEGSFSSEPALTDVRNLAAEHGANAVVVEGHAHEEHHGELGHETYFQFHASAYLCPTLSR